MEEAEASRYWCHMCLQNVDPIIDIETIKCPSCQSGFVEELASAEPQPENDTPIPDLELGGDRALSLWAPILLGMMSNNPPHRSRNRLRRLEFDSDEETELDRELDSIMRSRRRSSAAILQLLHGLRAGILSESSRNSETNQDGDNDTAGAGGRVVLVNPLDQTIISGNTTTLNRAPLGSLGDYFMGPGLDLLLQHLAENDPNRYGTPPAQKEAVEALATVKIKETVQCSVCLDECEIASEVKEMPCKHKFHSECILPWLELHSSCPVCRYQLPSEECKTDSGWSRNDSSFEESIDDISDGDDSGRRISVPLPWPFSSLFPSSSPQSNGGTSSNAPPSI